MNIPGVISSSSSVYLYTSYYCHLLHSKHRWSGLERREGERERERKEREKHTLYIGKDKQKERSLLGCGIQPGI